MMQDSVRLCRNAGQSLDNRSARVLLLLSSSRPFLARVHEVLPLSSPVGLSRWSLLVDSDADPVHTCPTRAHGVSRLHPFCTCNSRAPSLCVHDRPTMMPAARAARAEAKYNVTTTGPNLGLHSAAANGNIGQSASCTLSSLATLPPSLPFSPSRFVSLFARPFIMVCVEEKVY
jgi:hypothetical protein